MPTVALERPNYTGDWEFSRSGSRLEIARPDDVALHIEHVEPAFHLERTLRFGPQSSTFAIDLAVGEEHDPVERGDSLVYPSLYWDENDLVFESKIVRRSDQATNTVRYRLQEEGTVLIADESFRSPTQRYDNQWVFRKEEP